MRLSRLELNGFKSFANITAINLPEKIIAVVGPNGCGKSNISDAMRWVLGVQSAKLLRGKRMDDFIFNGSRSRKPMGMAQVSLTLENGDGAVKVAGLEGFSEVTITRRVYRDGEGEYYINKTPCRLRDIADLFMDVGVRANILSVIEQGQVEQIVNARPEDRRFIIEEVAGIAKYKDRKETALRKLEHSESNLLRIKDIMAEVKRQLNSLSRQAARAERYKKCKQEANELALAILSAEYLDIAGHLEELRHGLSEARERNETLTLAHSTADNHLESLRLALAQTSSEINKLGQEIHQIEVEALRTEAQIQRANSEAQACLSWQERLSVEIRELNEKLIRLEKESEDRSEEASVIARTAAEKSQWLQEARKQLDDLKEEEAILAKKLEEERSHYIDIMSSISSKRNLLISCETQQQNLANRVARVKEEQCSTAASIEELKDKIKGKEALLNELQTELNALKERKGRLAVEIEDVKEKLTKSEEEVASLTEEHSHKRARINSIEELLKSYEGYRDGSKTVLMGRGNGNSLEGIRGAVAELLETYPKYEVAIEAALGEKLHYLVAEDHNSILKALEYLKSCSGGRSTLIPINPRADSRLTETLNDYPGVLGRARDLIKCAPEYSELFDYLLGDVLVVADMATALDLWSTDPMKATIVTLEGEVIDAAGATTGGSSIDMSESILRRRRVLMEMKQALDKLSPRFEAAIALREKYMGSHETLKRELEQVDERLRKAEVADLGCLREVELIGGELRGMAIKLEAENYEEQELLREKEELIKEQQSAQVGLKHLEDEKLQSERLTQGLRAMVEALQERVEELKRRAIREEIEQKSCEERHDKCLQDIERLLGEEEEARLKLQHKSQQQEEAIRQREEQLHIIEGLKAKLAELEGEKGEKSEALLRKRESYDEAQGHLTSLENEVRSLREKMESSREHLHSLSVQEAELKIQIENILESARSNYGADLKNDSIAPPGNLEECKERLAQLKDTIGKMGDVNMSALQEYEELKGRYDFLLAQHDDLVRSIEDLHHAIEKTNRTTRTRFREAYEKVNVSFKEMFSRLFYGGEAELILTDERDLLETGVEIVARPPGKRLQNITLLSSGEKTLTSLALLFGVFLTKPSPFCLLDEVDASLDEANINRFTGILKELADKTQFIVITHNKRTIAAADLLYGITMEEEGVSKVLSLRLVGNHETI